MLTRFKNVKRFALIVIAALYGSFPAAAAPDDSKRINDLEAKVETLMGEIQILIAVSFGLSVAMIEHGDRNELCLVKFAT